MATRRSSFGRSCEWLPPPSPKEGEIGNDEEATEAVHRAIESHTVLVWTMEGPSEIKLFDASNIQYEVINLCEFKYDSLSNNMKKRQHREALCSLTRCTTFPQFFVDGVFVGDEVEASIKWQTGELRYLLERALAKKENQIYLEENYPMVEEKTRTPLKRRLSGIMRMPRRVSLEQRKRMTVVHPN